MYIRSLETAGLAPSSVRGNLAAARALFRALRWAGATVLDPFSDARPKKDKTAAWDKRQPYSDEEVQTLLRMASPRDRTLILLCAHGGLRIEEALGLTWEEVDLAGGAITVRRGKGGKSRRVTMTHSLLAALQALPTGEHIIGGTQDRPPPAPPLDFGTGGGPVLRLACLPALRRDAPCPADGQPNWRDAFVRLTRRNPLLEN